MSVVTNLEEIASYRDAYAAIQEAIRGVVRVAAEQRMANNQRQFEDAMEGLIALVRTRWVAAALADKWVGEAQWDKEHKTDKQRKVTVDGAHD